MSPLVEIKTVRKRTMLRQLFHAESCTYTYLITDACQDCAIFIDPAKDRVEQYLTLLDELSLSLIAALDTHTHADHITGTGLLRERTGCDIVMSSATKAEGVTKKLNCHELFTYGGNSICCIHTPGHTKDSCCFYVKQAGALFTGDTLLIRGSGRTDFQEGSSSDAWHSIMHVLMKLPEETLIYPGHDYKGMTVSSLKEEKVHNPRLQVGGAKEYAALMKSLNLPYPSKIDEALPKNLKCGI